MQPIPVSDASRAAVLEFLERRLEQLLADSGLQIEAVRAALRERGRNAALAARTAHEIAVRAWVGSVCLEGCCTDGWLGGRTG